MIAIGLFVALFVFSPPESTESASIEIAPAENVNKVTEDQPSRVEPVRSNRPTNTSPKIEEADSFEELEENEEPTDETPGRGDLPSSFRRRTFSPDDQGGRPEVYRRGKRSDALRDARRAIFRDGTEPDWNQFEDSEKEMLEKIWERYQRRGSLRREADDFNGE